LVDSQEAWELILEVVMAVFGIRQVTSSLMANNCNKKLRLFSF
jgi:hypothetical protein